MRLQLNVPKLKQLMAHKGITQSDLARQSRVSRATVARLLGQEMPWVRVSTATKLAEAVGLPEAGLDPRGVETAYLGSVARQHEALDFTGLGIVVVGSPMPMDRGFAPVKVREWPASKGLPREPNASAQTVPSAGLEPTALGLRAAVARWPRLYLLGDPGSGKTTALRYIARVCAQRSQSDGAHPPGPLVPVYLRLADWAEQLAADGRAGLLDAALAGLSVAEPRQTLEWLHRQAGRSSLLVLLDGLDEVAGPESRGRMLNAIRSFVAAHQDAKVVITSRVAGFEAPNLGAPFEALVLQPLEPEAMRQFVKEWCSFRHGHTAGRTCKECETRERQVSHAIAANPRVGALAGNPLMLTILALLHEAGASLPERRWDLYQKVTEAFLFSWEERKRRALAAAPDRALRLGAREVLWLLESLALEMQRRDLTLAPRWWLAEHAASFLQGELSERPEEARAQTELLLWSLRERAGLLVERTPQHWGFSHLAFQEYFAARAVLGSADPVEALRPLFYHPAWQEVVRLVAAQIDRHRAPQLFRAILDDPDPTGRFLQRGLLIVLSCLLDGAPFYDSGLREEVVRRFAAMAETAWPLVRWEATMLVHQLMPLSFWQESLGISDEQIAAAERQSLAALRGVPPVVQAVAANDDDQSLRLVFGDHHPSHPSTGWQEAVLNQLAHDPSAANREECAKALGRLPVSSALRPRIVELFLAEKEPGVRQAMARLLGRFAGSAEVLSLLLERVEADPHEEVRGACARGLCRVAEKDAAVAAKLVSMLTSAGPPAVRAGAAAGLARRAAADVEVRKLLVGILRDPKEHDAVRAGCLCALEEILPSLLAEELPFVKSLLGGPPDAELTRCAARMLAEHAVSGRVAWKDLPVERVEHALASLRDPCPRVLQALRGILDARERRRLGIPREARIARALSEFRDRIRAMFIFGSAARNEQGAESDIDLMVIGDVTLRDLTPGLKSAEHELGRQVNVVIYSEEDWRDRCRRKDPFVMNVLNDKTVFVSGGRDELRAMGG